MPHDASARSIDEMITVFVKQFQEVFVGCKADRINGDVVAGNLCRVSEVRLQLLPLLVVTFPETELQVEGSYALYVQTVVIGQRLHDELLQQGEGRVHDLWPYEVVLQLFQQVFLANSTVGFVTHLIGLVAFGILKRVAVYAIFDIVSHNLIIKS